MWKKDADIYIVVSKNPTFSNEITNMMVLVFGISASIIIDFYLYYKATIPLMTVDKRMAKHTSQIDGIVLGISHAEVGIIPEIIG